MNFSSLAGHIIELLELNEKNNHPTDRLVAEYLKSRKYIGSHDRRFISHSLYGIVRFRKRLNVLLHQYTNEHPEITETVSRKTTTLTQFVAYAAVVEEFEPQQLIDNLQQQWRSIAPSIDLHDFPYWLVRNKSLNFLQGDDVQQLADWYSFEEWMVREWVEQFGQDGTEDLLHALNSEAHVTLRVNTLKTTVDQCQELLKNEGIETTQTRYSKAGLIAAKRFNAQFSKAFKEGSFEIQDEGSQIICYLAQPQPGGFVVDACAGAGGKSLTIAQLMKNKGEILAFDVERKRLNELEKRAHRSGADIIVARKTGDIHPGDLLGKADVVLVDAPCSGVGTIRRNPGFKWSVTPELMEQYAKKQFEIVDSNASYVRRGGRLVYATCSLFRKENENVVGKFLERHSEFQPMLPTSVLLELGIEHQTDSQYLKLLPHRHDTDGFFVAILERKG